MASTLKLRGGDSATVGAITPAARELLVNTDTNRAHVGDGSTVGGNPLALLSDVTSSTGTTNLSGSGTASVYTIASDTGTDATIPSATTSAAGVMTAADKTSLDALVASGGSTDLALANVTASTVDVTSSNGTDATITAATNAAAGVATAAQITELEAIRTVLGGVAGDTDLATFLGDIISDNVTLPVATQEIETAVIKNRFTQGTEATAMDNTQNYIIAASGTVTLPASPFTGQRVWVYDATGAANTTNIAVNNSAAVLQTNLDQNSQFKAFAWNGSAWVILWDSKAHLPQKHLHVAEGTTLQNGQNYIIFADTAAALSDIVITLPVAPVVDQSIWIYDQTDNATTWNVLTGSDIRLYSDGASIQLVYDGAAWQTVFDSQVLGQKSISSKVGTGPGYYFEGTTDIIDLPNIFSATNGIDDLPITVAFSAKVDSGGYFAVSKLGASNPVREWAALADLRLTGTVTLFTIWDTSGNSHSVTIARNTLLELVGGKKSTFVFVYNGAAAADFAVAGNFIDVFINGKKIPVSVANNASYGGMSATAQPIWVGRSSSTFAEAEVYNVAIFNRALTASEVEQVSNGQNLGFTDYGASGVAQTSGTLTVGKRYIISDYIAGDDFTNVGAAANATGEVFIATGTTPTTWANLSGVTQQGLVLDLNENGIGEDTWADASGNAYDGTVTGATAINLPKYEEINTNYVKLTDLIWIGIDGGVLSKTNDAGSTWTAI